MAYTLLHAGLERLPMGQGEAGLTLGMGLLVLVVVAYDLYRHRWSGGR